nr:ketoacyl-synthetase C-terminal extension domain-containing protein [Streptomyces sp. DSM 41633]
MALQHGIVPPNLHFTRLPDEMARIETDLFVPTETVDWPLVGSHPRRAAVSSDGLSGTNVHAVRDQAPPVADRVSGSLGLSGSSLFALSATSADELRRTAGRLADWLADRADVDLTDLAYTLARRRAHRPVRTAVVADD